MQGLQAHTTAQYLDRRSRDALAELAEHIGFLWPALPAPLTIGWSEEIRLVLDGGVPWIFGPAERDPLRGQRGSSVLPKDARKRLKKIAASGVTFPRVAIAHELDPDGPVKPLLPSLLSRPLLCTDDLAKTLVGPVPMHPRIARILRIVNWAISGAQVAARSSAEMVGKVFDPIVFGVIAPTPLEEGRACLWFPMTAWRW